MATQSMLVPPPVGGAVAPPINIDALDSRELKELCKGMFTDLSFLAGVVPANVGSLLSSSITAAAALGAGAIDGYLGDKSNIGPVGLSAAIAVGMAGFAMVTKNPDHREAAAAVARGFGAPLLYDFGKSKVTAWKAKQPVETAKAGDARQRAASAG